MTIRRRFHSLILPVVALVTACVPRQEASTQGAAAQAPQEQVAPVPEPAPIGPALEPPSEGAFVSGKYRNLFEELGKPVDEVSAKLDAAYQKLFHGDPKEEAVMFEAGKNENGPLAYIMDIANNDIRSEGMSYGMMISVQLDKKAEFDALWNWAKTYMYHSKPTHPVYGYFSWQMRPDGTAMDEMPAPDGEEYFATALLFAAHRWQSGKGLYDYQKQALELLGNMKNRASISGTVNAGKKTTCVALFNPERKMVRFTPDTNNFSTNGDHTDPSYHLPAFYELWALWGPEADRAFWADAAKVSRDFFVKAAHPRTGLSPDYANFDGTPKAASWDAHTADFRYDAWRTAMNWSVDYAWWAKDRREVELSDRILAFFATQGPNYKNTFTLDGKPTSEYDSLGLVATNAVAALAASHPRAWHFVDTLYKWQPPTGKYRYYDGMLYLMAMLHVSGNFRVYPPAGSAKKAAVFRESGLAPLATLLSR